MLHRLGSPLRKAWHLLIATVLLVGSTHASPGDIELRYRTAGPWATTVQTHVGCCDSAGNDYAAWWPSALGQGGALHPVITWGNGTGAPPEAYAYFLDHLASWGFVVIASRQPSAGSGQELRDAIAYLQAENERAGSPFYQHLDMTRVGAMGHSQGAMGALNAMRDSGGSVRTAVALAIPAQSYCPRMGHCTDTATLTTGSVLFINGSLDHDISPSVQAADLLGLQSNKAYYLATPTRLPKAWGTLVGTGHSDVMGHPNCPPNDSSCRQGVQGLLGYPTAWMMDRLQGDATAHTAFVRGSGEFFVKGGAWRHQVSNIRP